MRIFKIPICVIGVSFAPQLSAQQTMLYAYDGLGRVTHAGTNDTNTVFYVYDLSGNRLKVLCCKSIGGQQIKNDGFDPYFYLQTYADVRAAGMDPYAHWQQYGASENRQPNRYFNTSWYRLTYGIPGNVNPLTEYNVSGWQQGHNPSPEFSTTAYHAAHPDTAIMNPLTHYLGWGYGEGRTIFPVP